MHWIGVRDTCFLDIQFPQHFLKDMKESLEYVTYATYLQRTLLILYEVMKLLCSRCVRLAYIFLDGFQTLF